MLANRERILQKMEDFNLDVLIASFPENVNYLADFQSHLSTQFRFFDMESFAIFPRSQDAFPTLVVPPGDGGWVTKYPSSAEEIFFFGTSWTSTRATSDLNEREETFKKIVEDPEYHFSLSSEAIIKGLQKMALDKGRVGLDYKGITQSTLERVKAGLPNAEIIDAFELFRIIRMVKTPEEIQRLIKVGVLNERAMGSVLRTLKEGVSEDELFQTYLESIAKEGAVFEYWNTAAGTMSCMGQMASGHTHPKPGHRLKNGDMYRYDGGCIYNKYHADVGGTAVIGTPSLEQRSIYQALEAGMERAMELLRPGELPSRIFGEAVSTVERAGLKDFSKHCYFCGHGIGIECRDYPIFRNPVTTSNPFLKGSFEFPVEENMVISLEFPYGKLGVGGFQVEYTLLVTKSGCQKLYPHKRELLAV